MQDSQRKYVAFFDAEYTADNQDNKGLQEMIQCSLLVYEADINKNGSVVSISSEIKDSFVSYIKPIYNKELSEYIIKLTGIQQSSVSSGVSITKALDSLLRLVKSYDIKTIYVWGPDAFILKENMRFVDYDINKSNAILSPISDVSEKVSNAMGFSKVLSQSAACILSGIEQDGRSHDAFSDSKNLVKIVTKVLIGAEK